MNKEETSKYKCGIYKIENKINYKIYIGQSIDIMRRWREHKVDSDDSWIHKAIKKYGIENFSFSIIEECNQNELDEKEKYWISYYNSFGEGYNQNPGGKDNALFTAIENSKKEVLQYNLQGELINTFPSTREAERQTGILHIAEVCRHERDQSQSFVWRYTGDPFTSPVLHKKQVQQLNSKTLEIIATYDSIVEASKATNINRNGISAVCNGRRQTAGGYFWRLT